MSSVDAAAPTTPERLSKLDVYTPEMGEKEYQPSPLKGKPEPVVCRLLSVDRSTLRPAAMDAPVIDEAHGTDLDEFHAKLVPFLADQPDVVAFAEGGPVTYEPTTPPLPRSDSPARSKPASPVKSASPVSSASPVKSASPAKREREEGELEPISASQEIPESPVKEAKVDEDADVFDKEEHGN